MLGQKVDPTLRHDLFEKGKSGKLSVLGRNQANARRSGISEGYTRSLWDRQIQNCEYKKRTKTSKERVISGRKQGREVRGRLTFRRVQMTRGVSFACAIRLTPHGAFPHLCLNYLFTPPLPARVRCVPRDTTSSFRQYSLTISGCLKTESNRHPVVISSSDASVTADQAHFGVYTLSLK